MEPKVAIIMGSKSDFPKVKVAADTLDEFEIPYTLKVFSAHRSPKQLEDFVEHVDNSDNYKVVIAAAGMSAALAGAIAAKTIKPVIGIPISGSKLDGIDALLSTVQMPPGIPVACMGIDASKNAALQAISIIALNDPIVANDLRSFRVAQGKKVLEANNESFDAELKFRM